MLRRIIAALMLRLSCCGWDDCDFCFLDGSAAALMLRLCYCGWDECDFDVSDGAALMLRGLFFDVSDVAALMLRGIIADLMLRLCCCGFAVAAGMIVTLVFRGPR